AWRRGRPSEPPGRSQGELRSAQHGGCPMNTLLLALRNLLRNRRRSLMTLFAMVIGLVAVLLFGGYIRDINYALQSDFVRLTGHLQIQHRDYFLYGSGNPAAYGIRDYARILSIVKKDPVLAPMLAVATP